MEHSYSKDIHPKGNVEVMATRNILIPRPPQCPSCHQHSSNDDILAVSLILINFSIFSKTMHSIYIFFFIYRN